MTRPTSSQPWLILCVALRRIISPYFFPIEPVVPTGGKKRPITHFTHLLISDTEMLHLLAFSNLAFATGIYDSHDDEAI